MVGMNLKKPEHKHQATSCNNFMHTDSVPSVQIILYLVLLQSKEQDWGRIAQLVDCQTKKPCAIPAPVRFPGAARDFSPRVNFLKLQTLIRCSYSPSVQSHACINICLHIKNPKHWQPNHCLHTQKH